MRMLVAGIGNIFLGDDGFGVEVANRLAAKPQPEGVTVSDYGIRGLHLAYEMLDGYDVVIFIDTVNRGDVPGTITVMEVDPNVGGGAAPDAHDMDPVTVLSLLADLGGQVDRLLVVGCEAEDLEEGIGLSGPVESVVDKAVRVIEELIQRERTALRAGRES